jgi:hypothetical protein
LPLQYHHQLHGIGISGWLVYNPTNLFLAWFEWHVKLNRFSILFNATLFVILKAMLLPMRNSSRFDPVRRPSSLGEAFFTAYRVQ